MIGCKEAIEDLKLAHRKVGNSNSCEYASIIYGRCGHTEEDAKKQLAAIEISKAQNEAIIATKDGEKEVKPSRGETEHFFAHKSGKVYIITHKPSGKALPAVVTKYGTKLSDFQKVMKDLEDANIAGIGDENPSPPSS